AGKAVAHALASAGIASLDLFDIDAALQQALVTDLRRHPPGLQVDTMPGPAEAHALLINAPPCGMAPSDPQPFELVHSRPGAVVADLIMKPERTPLLQAAE